MQIVNAAADVLTRRNRPPSEHTIAGYGYAIPRRVSPGVCLSFRPGGRGECRVPSAPAASCAKVVVGMHTSIHSEVTGIIRHSRTQWFTAYSALSPVIGFLATVAGGKLRRLDASTEASGPHGFAVRETRRSSKAHPRPPHPAPTFVTIASAPLAEQDGRAYSLIRDF